MKGNVVDLAVGVIIGGAFGGIVKSMIDDLIMPVVGMVTGGIDFSNMYVPLSDKVQKGLALADARKAGAVFAYGNFISILINFMILAFVIFLMIKAMNTAKKKMEREQAAGVPSVPAPSAQELYLKEIRDLLARR
jgi:large conductance mechanosensitive channel